MLYKMILHIVIITPTGTNITLTLKNCLSYSKLLGYELDYEINFYLIGYRNKSMSMNLLVSRS